MVSCDTHCVTGNVISYTELEDGNMGLYMGHYAEMA